MSGPCNSIYDAWSFTKFVSGWAFEAEFQNMVTFLGVTLWVEVSPRVMSAPVGQLAVDEYGHWVAVQVMKFLKPQVL